MTRDYNFLVYILASKPHGTLYVGVTNDLVRRVLDHRSGEGTGFTKRYKVHCLVCFERHGDINEAIAREKRLKRWRREWKFNLIERENPRWLDLLPNLLDRGSRTGAFAPSGMTPPD